MKIAISAESTIDLTKELLKEFDIHTIPFTFELDSKEYTDGDLTNPEMFEIVDKTGKLPKTASINVARYTDYFKSILDGGYDGIVHISLSSGISSTSSNAIIASREFENVKIVDSESLSTGIALLAVKGAKLAKEGKELNEIVNTLNETVSKVQASFILHNIKYLYKGGRCSLLALLSSTALNIRPQIIVDKGKMYPGDKYFGNYNRCVAKYCESTLKKFDNPDKSLAFVTYSSIDNREMAEICINALKEAGFERILETTAGSTIACHCGEMCIGILYIRK